MENPKIPKKEIDYKDLMKHGGECGGLGLTDETVGPYTVLREKVQETTSKTQKNNNN